MPNGYDKNWIRLCAAIDGFRARYGSWPTKVRLFPSALQNLQQDVFTPESFHMIEQHIQLIPDEAPIVAEDDSGRRYSYGEKGFSQVESDIRAET